MTTITSNAHEAVAEDTKLVLLHLDEGLDGDFDADDPNDKALYRLDVFLSVAAAERAGLDFEVYDEEGAWATVQDSSFCTQLPLETVAWIRAELLGFATERVQESLATGSPSLKRVCEALSWMRPEWVDHEVRDAEYKPLV